jgi:hypothetical protein
MAKCSFSAKFCHFVKHCNVWVLKSLHHDGIRTRVFVNREGLASALASGANYTTAQKLDSEKSVHRSFKIWQGPR